MRIVVENRRYRLGTRHYTLDIKIDYRSIPDDLLLTDKVLEQYRRTKNNIGFTTFRGLDIDDIKSILSAVKRQEAHVSIERMGNCAFYKLHR